MSRFRYMAAAAAGAAVLVLAACGSGSGGGGGGSTGGGGSSASGTLRVLLSTYPSSNAGKAALQKVIDAFHKDYPHVTVQPDLATFTNLNQKMTTSIASDQPYDVYVTGIGWIPPFGSKGLFANLAQFGFNAKKLGEVSSPSMVSASSYNGKVYGYPLIIGAKPLALSVSAFKAAGLKPVPPTSFAQLLSDAKALSKVRSQGFDFWSPPGSYRQAFVSFLGATGTAMAKANGSPNYTGAGGQQALAAMKSLIDAKASKFGDAAANMQPEMLNEAAGMGFTGSYMDCSAAGVGQKTCSDLKFFNLQDKATAMYCGGELASVGANSPLKKAAFDFIQKMATVSAEEDMGALNLSVPAAKGAATAPLVKNNPDSQFVYSHLNQCVFEGGAPDWLDARAAFGPGLDSALLGKTAIGPSLTTIANSPGTSA